MYFVAIHACLFAIISGYVTKNSIMIALILYSLVYTVIHLVVVNLHLEVLL